MEETYCDACGIHFKPGRKHFYEDKHKQRINTHTQEDIESIKEIKDAIENKTATTTDITKYYIHCRYCECACINTNVQTGTFTNAYEEHSILIYRTLIEHLSKKRHKEKVKKYLRVFNGKRELLPQLIIDLEYYNKVSKANISF